MFLLQFNSKRFLLFSKAPSETVDVTEANCHVMNCTLINFKYHTGDGVLTKQVYGS